jgi:NADH-quinone oxidoreductase subunit N
MFLKDPIEGANAKFMQNASIPMKSVIGFCVFLAIASVLFIDPLLKIIDFYVTSSGF